MNCKIECCICQIILSSVINGEVERISEETNINDEDWINLSIIDNGESLEVRIDERLELEKHTVRRTLPIKNFVGLVVIRGSFSIRQFEISKKI